MSRWWLVLIPMAALLGQAWPVYHEPYRPQFHFSPRDNWTNDPNGLVYLDGKYNLFFQNNPFGDVWGHMSWGHAASRDLVHWSQLPVALREENGVMIFTGSTVADMRNTSGFCTSGPCLVAVYTGHTMKTANKPALQTQNLAYSNDGGVTWTKYAGNPVLDLHMADFRDPKVFWSEAGKQWVMAVSMPDDHQVRFYGSADLKKWTQVGAFGPAGAVSGQWECPELFELPITGGRGTRWVLKVGLNPGGLQGGSGEQYFVGTFDGRTFKNDNPASLTLWTDYGKDCYCALTFNHLPQDVKPVMMGWMNNWQYANQVPTKPWRGQMTVPRGLELRRFAEGIRLLQEPVKELEELREQRATYSAASADELNLKLRGAGGDTVDLVAAVRLGKARSATWRVLAGGGAYTEIGYDGVKGLLFVDRTKSGNAGFSHDFPAHVSAPYEVTDGELKLRVLIDKCSVEVFTGDGRVAMTNLVFPPPGADGVELRADGAIGGATVERWRLRSIW